MVFVQLDQPYVFVLMDGQDLHVKLVSFEMA